MTPSRLMNSCTWISATAHLRIGACRIHHAIAAESSGSSPQGASRTAALERETRGHESRTRRVDGASALNGPRMTLYQAEWCPFSAAVREVLTELGIDV